MIAQAIIFIHILNNSAKNLTFLVSFFVILVDLKYQILDPLDSTYINQLQSGSFFSKQASLLVIMALLCIRKPLSFFALLFSDFFIRLFSEDSQNSFSQASFILFLTGVRFVIERNSSQASQQICDDLVKEREYLIQALQVSPIPTAIYQNEKETYLLKNQSFKDWENSENYPELYNFIDTLKTKENSDLENYRFLKGKLHGTSSYTLFIQDYKKKIEKMKTCFEKTKTEELATATHELRTPLNSLIGMLNCINTRSLDEESKKYIDISLRSSKLLLSLTNSIIDQGQLLNGSLTLNFTLVDSHALVQEVSDLMGFMARQKGITFLTKIEKNSPSILYTDKLRLQQVLTNLLGNAIKFTSQGSVTLYIQLNSSDSNLVDFSVTDTGSGIKQEDFAKLFRPFSKLKETSSLNSNGSGLGLLISQNLVKALARNQDSSITLASQLNKGSTFTFSIPFKNPKQKNNDQGSDFLEDSNSDYSILEDEPSARDIILFPPTSDSSFSTKNFTSPLQKTISSTDIRFEKDHRQKSQMNLLFDSSKKTISYKRLEPSSPLKLGNAVSLIRLPTETSNPSPESLAMLVDDSPFNLFALATMLRSIGVQSKTAFSGRNCIEVVLDRAKKAKPFDIIFLDYLMPDLDGAETTKILRKMMVSQQIPEVPIIGLTALYSPEDEKKCLNAGMMKVLRKPIDKESLLCVLKDVNL